jgi:hypothetical protein
MPEEPGGTCRVVYFPQVVERMKGLAKRAVALGLAEQFREDLQQIQQKLLTESMTWGDPIYRLRHLGLVVHHRLEATMQILYAVDEQRRIVYVKEIKLRPDHPLGQEP